ncbi:alpha-amylase family protein, partial [mine drainage metagenome]
MQEILIENVLPAVDGGRYPARALIGDAITVTCDIICHGTYVLDARIRYKSARQRNWSYAELRQAENDSWTGQFKVEKIGMYAFAIEAWIDPVSTHIRDAAKWIEAGEDVSSDILAIRNELSAILKGRRVRTCL